MTVQTVKNASGRPARHPGERLSKNRTFRVRGPLDTQLIQAAATSGRSVSEEIEFRLERTFADQTLYLNVFDHVYGSENVALVTACCEIIKSISFFAPLLALSRTKSEHLDANWLDDAFLFEEAVQALNTFFEAIRPKGNASPPKNYKDTLHNLGKRSAHAVLALIAEGPASNSESLGWAQGTRRKLSYSTLLKIIEANAPDSEGSR